ncbi:MAG TPA: hypothetical protein VIL20_13610 [Sandaracinaceae bacterium]
MRVLAGCAGPDTDIEPSLVFAELSDAEIVRVIGAAILGDVVTAEDRIARIVGDGTDPCPTVTTAGATATITGGCTTATGIAIDGSAVVTNPLRWERGDLAPDPSGATTYDLDALTLVFPDEPWQVFDGTLRHEHPRSLIDADLTVPRNGRTVRSDLRRSCWEDGTSDGCTYGGGVELAGVGGAHVTAEIRSDVPVPTFHLTGRDRLVVTLNGLCSGWKIEGTDRERAGP